MNKKQKIMLLGTVVLLLLYTVWFIWVLLGNPYLRLHLIGTDYIEHSDNLYELSKEDNATYYLVKKYKYSKDVWLIGFGGGGNRVDDYYGLGIADKNKTQILPAKYEYLEVMQDYKTKEVYIHCVPFLKTGQEPFEYFRIENNKAIAIQR